MANLTPYSIGQKINSLTIIERTRLEDPHNAYWKCKCDCGAVSVLRGFQLKQYPDCQFCRKAAKKHRIHLREMKEYYVWYHMIRRCENPKYRGYKHYGGRGISVCERWKANFWNFYEDMGVRLLGLTIERIDNEKGYFPEKCKWASMSEQSRNRRTTKYIEFRGVKRSLAEWLELRGITSGQYYDRINRLGLTPEEAIVFSG